MKRTAKLPPSLTGMEHSVSHARETGLDFLTEPDGLDLLSNMVANRFTTRQIAEHLHVGVVELARLLKTNPKAIEAVEIGTAILNSEVESRMLDRITGYDYAEETLEPVGVDPITGETTYMCVKKVVKHVLPSEKLITEWLKARDPDKWSGDALIQFNTVNVSAEDKAQAARAAIQSILAPDEPQNAE